MKHLILWLLRLFKRRPKPLRIVPCVAPLEDHTY